MDDDEKQDGYLRDPFDRVEAEGVATSDHPDGRILAFSAAMLRRLLDDAEAAPQEKLIRRAPEGLA